MKQFCEPEIEVVALFSESVMDDDFTSRDQVPVDPGKWGN